MGKTPRQEAKSSKRCHFDLKYLAPLFLRVNISYFNPDSALYYPPTRYSGDSGRQEVPRFTKLGTTNPFFVGIIIGLPPDHCLEQSGFFSYRCQIKSWQLHINLSLFKKELELKQKEILLKKAKIVQSSFTKAIHPGSWGIFQTITLTGFTSTLIILMKV